MALGQVLGFSASASSAIATSKDLLGNVDERAMVAEKNGGLFAELDLNFLRDLAPGIGPVDLIFQLAFEESERPRDGLLKGQAGEPVVEGLGRVP